MIGLSSADGIRAFRISYKPNLDFIKLIFNKILLAQQSK